jgi:hypothetical protein
LEAGIEYTFRIAFVNVVVAQLLLRGVFTGYDYDPDESISYKHQAA